MDRLGFEQPGLEVAPSNAPEVIARPSEGYLIPISTSGFKINTPCSIELPTEQSLLKRKTFIWTIGIIIGTVLVIGAVVGGVIGSRAGSTTANSTTAPSTTASPLPVPVNTTVSRLSFKISWSHTVVIPYAVVGGVLPDVLQDTQATVKHLKIGNG